MDNKRITLFLAIVFCHSLIGHAQELPLTQEAGYQGQPAIWGDWVVWRDVQPEPDNSSNIYAKNLTTQQLIQLSDSGSAGPADIYEYTVVWADQRNGDYDLFTYDLSTNTPTDLYVEPGDQFDPVIYDGNVAFISGEDPLQEIWLYSISREVAWRISEIQGYKWKPDISEDVVVWGDYRSGNWDIYGYDINDYNINEPNDFPIADGSAYQRSVAVSGDTLVFEDTISPSGNSNIGIYNLSTKEDPNYIRLPGGVDWLDIYGEILVWGEYSTSTGTNIYGYDLTQRVEFAVCTKPGWQYAPVIYDSTIVFSSDSADEASQQFYDRDVYYRRIGDINESDGRTSTGKVWEFKIANVINVDDMESYDPYDNMIWHSWDNPNGTGSWIDLGLKPWQPVNNGVRSMEYSYDNTDVRETGVFYSEAISVFDDPCDWLTSDVNILFLYFYGDAENITDRMYVALTDSAGYYAEVSYDDPTDLNISQWQKWEIPLSGFDGVNRAEVQAIHIGFGDRNSLNPTDAYGVVYFDEITLIEGRYGGYGFNGDELVDFEDLRLLIEYWLENNAPVDLNADNLINLKDFAILARYWSK